jgi:hypothetical protein
VRVDRLLCALGQLGFDYYDYAGITEPHRIFGGISYRWAQGGAGYWLSRKAMEIISADGLHLMPAEDFAVGVLLALNGIHPFHDERYRSAVSTKDLENPDPNWITLHKVNHEWMRKLQ